MPQGGAATHRSRLPRHGGRHGGGSLRGSGRSGGRGRRVHRRRRGWRLGVRRRRRICVGYFSVAATAATAQEEVEDRLHLDPVLGRRRLLELQPQARARVAVVAVVVAALVAVVAVVAVVVVVAREPWRTLGICSRALLWLSPPPPWWTGAGADPPPSPRIARRPSLRSQRPSRRCRCLRRRGLGDCAEATIPE